MTSLLEHADNLVHDVVAPAKLTMRDISSWNGVPDINSLGAAIIASKATEGTGYVSPVFQRDWINTKNAHRGRMAYHFFHPSVSAMGQARFFLDTVKTAGLEAGDCLAIDVEQSDGLTAAEVNDAAVAFRDLVQKEVKCSLVVYCNRYFATGGFVAGLGAQPLWIAQPSAVAGHPTIAGTPWEHSVWTFHQYGERGGIDEDLCNFTSMETFYKFAIIPEPPPLTAEQRLVKLTDGHATTETIVVIENFRTGFKMTAGTATLTVVDDGLPKIAV